MPPSACCTKPTADGNAGKEPSLRSLPVSAKICFPFGDDQVGRNHPEVANDWLEILLRVWIEIDRSPFPEGHRSHSESPLVELPSH